MQQTNRFILLAQRTLLLMGLYSLCRLLFLLFNFSYFKASSIDHLLALFFYGLRFDFTAIVISNLLFIVLSVLPFSFFYKIYQRILTIIFIVVNSVALLFNAIDLEFFKFQGKRTTSDAFKIMSFGEDFTNTLPKVTTDFWYLIVIFAALVFIMVVGYNKTGKKSEIPNSKQGKVSSISYIISLAITTILCVIGFRGGLQYRPIDIMTASQYASGEEAALVLNSPFTILKTLEKSVIQPLHYFSKQEAETISPVIHPPSKEKFRALNVVVIIVESIGREYIGSLNNNAGYTPFLDSLIGHSLVFTNAFANGKRSIEGIPCVVAGLPALMPEPFITSAYNGNKLTSFASVLKSKGYTSMFFHGGTNGTMGFDNFCKSAGFNNYYGRKEYNNEKDFDGNWGIYDEPFLQFAAKKMNEVQTPFMATIFTISSHHPYAIPSRDKTKFKKGTLPIHESIQYADYSLRKFFETASKMAWFDSTLFVITADHTALSEYPFYQNHVGMYSIPIIFYRHSSGISDSLIGKSEITAQQIDILPTVLDYLHFDKPYFAFGTNLLATSSPVDMLPTHFAINYINDTYQLIAGNYSFTMDTTKVYSLYNIATDSLLKRNLLDEKLKEKETLEKKLKAFLQNYNDAILNNGMHFRDR